MKKFKIILTSVLSAVDLYLLYATIGYLVLGLKTPKIVGAENTTFMGMYIMSITYGCIFLVLTVVIIVLSFKFFHKKKSKVENRENLN